MMSFDTRPIHPQPMEAFMKLNSFVIRGALTLTALFVALALGQQQSPTPIKSISNNFNSINQRILDMAQDFPADKYDFRPTKEVRSFGEVIVHIISGNVFAAKAGRGERVNWDELNPKDFKDKAEIVAALQKSITDAGATLKSTPEERFTKTLNPWVDVIEHAAEHYGQLVVYYRVNGMTPPASRPAAK
ncbi:MAG TPA: DinB family protein [Blastocatellia bacterium]|jgi:uncharacterized damage-inducible protein DinB